MSRRETERILDAIRGVRASGTRAALATVVRVAGSAYRREGTQILVREDGTHECVLSGGCLEPAVAEAAARVIQTGEPSVVNYDLEDDSVFGLGIGCSGAIDIYIERVEDDDLTRAWLDTLDRAEPGVLVTPLAGATGRLLIPEQGAPLGHMTCPVADVVAAARERLAAPFPQSGPQWIGAAELFFAVSTPPPHLAIFGAGHDAVPLARNGYDLGFAVTVVDPREAFLTADRFPGITLLQAHFEEFAHTVALGPRSFVVVMNHHFERDRESLRFALASAAPYVGVLGPRSRLHRLFAALDAEGYRPEAAAMARVRSPIGLALGAETPEEIAASILGEVIAIQRGFDGGFLTGRETSLHRSRETRACARS
jgi:xanthine/CO dehydrogenase XdhC/CoxF family maturation factor